MYCVTYQIWPFLCNLILLTNIGIVVLSNSLNGFLFLEKVFNIMYFQHSGHSFKPLDEEYEVHKKKITDEINALRKRLLELDGKF